MSNAETLSWAPLQTDPEQVRTIDHRTRVCVVRTAQVSLRKCLTSSITSVRITCTPYYYLNLELLYTGRARRRVHRSRFHVFLRGGDF